MTSVSSVLFRGHEDNECCFFSWLASFLETISNSQPFEMDYLPLTFLDDKGDLPRFQSIETFSKIESIPSFASLAPYNHQKFINTNMTLPPLCSPDHHARISYLDVQSFGPPCNPLKFPPPKVYRGKRIDLRFKDPLNHHSYNCASKSIIRIYTSKDSKNLGEEFVSNKAYYRIPGRKKIKTGMGWIEICKVLEQNDREDGLLHEHRNGQTFRSDNDKSYSTFAPIHEQSSDSSSSYSPSSSYVEDEHKKQIDSTQSETVFFHETDKLVAVKVCHLKHLQKKKNRGSENALYEIAAMQMLGNQHANVLGCYEVLSDGTYIYIIMPYCEGGELYHRLQNYRLQNNINNGGLTEDEARHWFREILNGLHYLQAHGICHRDLSLENIMLTGNRCKIIDFGYCMRVSYLKRVYKLADGKVEVRKDRRLVSPRRPCGRESCMAPEFYNREVIDAFAIDLWAVGIILYEMLTGQVAYDRPVQDDDLFCLLTQELDYLLELCGVDLSEEVIDLLKGIFVEDPRGRFTLADIMTHPWVTMTG